MQIHIPVLKDEVLYFFKDIKGTYLDATLGYAGHSNAILENNQFVNLIACDQDDEAIEYSKQKLSKFTNRVNIIKTNYEFILNKINKNEIRAVLADIGVSSLQLDKDDRGFSFDSLELDMRMNKDNNLDAKYIVNNYSKDKLSEIFMNYAELPYKLASDIATNIINNRPINSCKELSAVIGNSKLNNRKVSLKTLVFQAIRIEVNDELGVLTRFLEEIEKLNNCLVCFITFHSLEDKIVKDTFKRWSKNCICDENTIRCVCGNNHSKGVIITKKPITPTVDEIKNNSRASCAKLRVFYINNER
ncbi:16S rRNA (cytosine(1402)-N(4))-methyltransferase RsmH [Campylobacter sp. MG1]|uniref:16S rRNA (cytosine(1402)-N(4))-methyltransferase RsmH n=1 Tax=Campylobacter sp. MG1 TaxID=2976332 RepID=UPI00226D0E37|nr:16S rRNA (cytosine(1402)-N(4))-methyltransferase RsmH [Campylobacter sp. MG1]